MTHGFPFHLLRPDIPREPPFWVSEIDHRAKLDQNECPFDLPKAAKCEILAELEQVPWNRYPQPDQYREVKTRFAVAVGQPPERLILTAGCDQLILLAFWVAGGKGRRARIWEPTYPMYRAAGVATQTDLDRIVLGPDYEISEQDLEAPADLVCLVSPNNPTGSGADRRLVRTALERDSLVLVDEAYADYAGDTIVDLVPRYANLLVARSLSKSLLAGVRLGYGIGHPELIETLENLIFSPYNLSKWQLAVASNFASIKPHAERVIESVIAERRRMEEALETSGVRFWPSRANFILFEVDEAATVNRHLLERGIRVRDVSALPGLGHHLRVTVGSGEENDLFLAALAEAMALRSGQETTD